MSCGNLDIIKLIDYYENGSDLSSYQFSNYNFYDLWNAAENGASPPNRVVCSTLSIPDILSITKAILGEFTTASEYLGTNLDFYYLYLKAIGNPDGSPTFTNSCIYELYQVFTVSNYEYLLSGDGDAAAAYSIRALNPDYTGACVTIRKSGDNAEDDFYFDSNNELSLDSENIGGTTLGTWIGTDNGFIKTWFDQSGSGNDATQTTTSSQPQIIISGSFITENGKPCLQLDGTNDNFYLSGVFSGATEFTYINIDKPNNTNVRANFWAQIQDLSNVNSFFRYNSNGKIEIFLGDANTSLDSFVSTSSYLAQQNLQFITYNSSKAATDQVDVFINNSDFGMSGTTAFAALNTISDAYIGSRITSNYFDGNIQEIIAFTTDKTTDRTVLQTNINNFYSIY